MTDLKAKEGNVSPLNKEVELIKHRPHTQNSPNQGSLSCFICKGVIKNLNAQLRPYNMPSKKNLEWIQKEYEIAKTETPLVENIIYPHGDIKVFFCSLEESERNGIVNGTRSYVSRLGLIKERPRTPLSTLSHPQLHNGDRRETLKHPLASRYEKDKI